MTTERNGITNMRKATHYVDNDKFLEALTQYKAACNEAVAQGIEKPILPNYIGECFIKISNHLAYKGNFINYSFRDDMVSDAIENCLVAAEKFDPEKSKNPFAYYTQIVYYAFIRRIQKEKKQQATKYKLLENIDIDEIITQETDSSDFSNQFLDYVKKQLDTIDPDRRTATPQKKSTKMAEETALKLEFDD
jgi:hypothetical protein